MVYEVTKGVLVKVQTTYLQEYSHPEQLHHVFSYYITIENSNNFPIRLLRRQWYIYDSDGSYNEVEGEGVVGEQPILEQNDKHEYSSGCNLHTTMGKMVGTYLFEKLKTKEQFIVKIPEFKLIAPFRLN